MAKFNPYWGKQTGKLGNTVLSVVRGEQVQRSYNGSPVNPKTYKQMGQRVPFAVAVKFFKQLTSAQFMFAFEDKRQRESDYNAFMRHNVKNAVGMFRDSYDSPYLPGFGYWRLSQGSLDGVDFGLNDDGIGVAVNAHTTAITTVGQFSTLLLQTYPGLMEGDIITFIGIKQNDDMTKNVIVNKMQFFIASGSTATLSSLGLSDTLVSGTSRNVRWAFENVFDGEIAFGAVIVSRETTTGLKVSTADVTMNEYTYDALSSLSETSQKRLVSADWGAKVPAILQGGLINDSVVTL